MNCCDAFGNCKQGRDCPIRQSRLEASKIAQSDDVEDATMGALDEFEKQILWLTWGLVGIFAVIVFPFLIFAILWML